MLQWLFGVSDEGLVGRSISFGFMVFRLFGFLAFWLFGFSAFRLFLSNLASERSTH